MLEAAEGTNEYCAHEYCRKIAKAAIRGIQPLQDILGTRLEVLLKTEEGTRATPKATAQLNDTLLVIGRDTTGVPRFTANDDAIVRWSLCPVVSVRLGTESVESNCDGGYILENWWNR